MELQGATQELTAGPFSILLRSFSEQVKQEKLKEKSQIRKEKLKVFDVISERSIMYPYSTLLQEISSSLPNDKNANKPKKHKNIEHCDIIFDNATVDKSIVEDDPNFVYSKKLLAIVEESKNRVEKDKIAMDSNDPPLHGILQNLTSDVKLENSDYCSYSLLLLRACKEYCKYSKVNNNSIDFDKSQMNKFNLDPAFLTEEISISSSSIHSPVEINVKSSKTEVCYKKYKKSVPDLIPCSKILLKNSTDESPKNCEEKVRSKIKESCGKCSLMFPNHIDLECHRKLQHSNTIEEKNRE